MKIGLGVLLFVSILGGVFLSFPTILAISVQHEQKQALSAMSEQFPVTVNPREKSIVEDALVNTFLESHDSPFQAAVGNVAHVFKGIFAWVAIGIADAPWYQSLAAVTVGDNRFITITPGMRKEQVATVFAKALAWNAKQKK
ncbi:MAG: hypothetical protein NUV88_00125, partial [Candidatus Kaiserbacteria bacterium]|nr:hypothetical protein [Candidatus Kaiserbacteria bacterium]